MLSKTLTSSKGKSNAYLFDFLPLDEEVVDEETGVDLWEFYQKLLIILLFWRVSHGKFFASEFSPKNENLVPHLTSLTITYESSLRIVNPQ